ncbi:hypothetical protein ACOSQ4_012676 [Xanthoceras sorbifolium]
MKLASSRLFVYLSCVLLHLVTLTVAQQSFLRYYWLSDKGKLIHNETAPVNCTVNTTYHENLSSLLLSGFSNSETNYGFYNFSADLNSDKVKVIALCRGDVNPDVCSSCIRDSVSKLLEVCCNPKEAIGFYDDCMLRFSNRSIFKTMEVAPRYRMINPENVTSLDQFNQVLRSLLDGLRSKAASGGSLLKFTTGNTSAPDFKTLYGLVQCTPDLSELQCNDCLDTIAGRIPDCCNGKEGATIEAPSCKLRYEIYRFYHPSADELTPPSNDPKTTKGKDGNNTRNIIIIIVSAVVGFVILIIFISIFLRTREGKLSNGQAIAVKRLSINSKQGDLEFKNEVSLVARLQHRNLVRLLGFCLERKERILVYEFVPNSSLDHFIFDPINREYLDWEKRYKILGGIARGILYLHEDSRLRIIHRDLKASNILLDLAMNPRIADFGMAKLFEIDQSHITTSNVVGTLGYIAPEYLKYKRFSDKSDVFSFGVLTLEIVSGQKRSCFSSEDEIECLVTYAWKSWNGGTAANLIDPTLGDDSRNEIMKCIHIGLLCVQESVSDRPTMASVVIMLNSNSLTLPAPSKPAGISSSLSSLEQCSGSRIEILPLSQNEASITEPFPR